MNTRKMHHIVLDKCITNYDELLEEAKCKRSVYIANCNYGIRPAAIVLNWQYSIVCNLMINRNIKATRYVAKQINKEL